MTCKTLVHRSLLLMMVVSLGSQAAWADNTPDPCSPATACTATCNSSPCQVQMNRNGSTLTLSLNGTDASVLCVPDYSTVSYAAASTNSLFGLLFSASHTPFSKSILVGSSSQPISSQATSPSAPQSCYVYSVAVCDFTGSCAALDPKVIVTGVHVGAKHAKKANKTNP